MKKYLILPLLALSLIACSTDEDDPKDQDRAPKGVVAVDMGLPSGTKWANMNVGAEKPEDYGLYFAWGETTGYTSDTSDGHLFTWETYKWMKPGATSWPGINKYQIVDEMVKGCWYDADGNFIGDGKSILDLEDDAAHVVWGGKWVMPKIEQIQELIANTTFEWTMVNGVGGMTFTSNINGNSFFLPAAGTRKDLNQNSSAAPLGLTGNGTMCGYPSTSVRLKADIEETQTFFYRGLFIDKNIGAYVHYNYRYVGAPVRAVQVVENINLNK